MSINQPVGQKRLTNVAVVRLKKGGKRFEIACYKNKVVSWRQGVEKDIDEVLQTHTVFINVSKGQFATKEDIVKVFGTEDQSKICLEILAKGELQVSDKERAVELDSRFHEIATIVAEKCIDRTTQKPMPVTLIEKAMRDMHYSINPNKNAKQQALDLIKLIQQRLPDLQRAEMQIKVMIPEALAKKVKAELQPHVTTSLGDKVDGGKLHWVFQIDPGSFRQVDEAVRGAAGASLEILNLAARQEGDDAFE
eukprot:tig00000488_g1346.t1